MSKVTRLLVCSGLVIASGLDQVAADKIAYNCIVKSLLQGVERGTSFSDEEFLTTKVEKNMLLYGYKECNDADGLLQSFQIVLADEFDENRL